MNGLELFLLVSLGERGIGLYRLQFRRFRLEDWQQLAFLLRTKIQYLGKTLKLLLRILGE